MRPAIILACLVFLVACGSNRSRGPFDSSVTVDSGSGDGGPMDGSMGDSSGPPPPPPLDDALDLILMIDNSNSMTEEQANFAMQLPRVLSALAESYASIHVGVVTTDMGTGGFEVNTCTESNFGDDGVLQTRGNTGIPGCSATYPSFLSYTAGADPGSFANDVSCVAVTGVGGCGFEQPLEAILKAVTPSTLGPVGAFDGEFTMGSAGHADGANAGFIRPGARLTIVALTDEEDCSASDPRLFDQESTTYPADLNLRCFSYPDAVHPVARYVDGLLAARDPARVSFVLTAGVLLEGTDYDAILADPSMEERVDPDMPDRLVPSCNTPGLGLAFPPRRMVMLARDLDARGARSSVQSICQFDYSTTGDAIIALSR